MPDIWNCREVYRGLGNKRAFKNPVVLGRGGEFFFSFFWRHRVWLHCGQKRVKRLFGPKKKGQRLADRGGGNCKGRAMSGGEGLDLSACAAKGCL